MAQLQAGDAAPTFDLPDQDGQHVSLGALTGTRFVFYFYPKADTAG